MSALYWHFIQVDNNGTPRLGHGDNREVKVGETLRVEQEPMFCSVGLHASAKLWDALGYAGGDKLSLCHVILGGTVLHDTDKSVATERTVIAMLDADATEKLLRDWGRWCALQVIHMWDAPDVVRQYLETGDEALRDAAAAEAEAEAEAWDAAKAAAWDAARDAAEAAAWDAARAAAKAAARAAARAAAEAEKIEEYAAELERRALIAMDSGQIYTHLTTWPNF